MIDNATTLRIVEKLYRVLHLAFCIGDSFFVDNDSESAMEMIERYQ